MFHHFAWPLASYAVQTPAPQPLLLVKHEHSLYQATAAWRKLRRGTGVPSTAARWSINDTRRSACTTIANGSKSVTQQLAQQEASWKEKLPRIFSALFAIGAVLGPALDGIHGRVHLLTYDSGQFYAAGVESSGWVALLLGTYYAIIGSLHIYGDYLQNPQQEQDSLYIKQSLPFVLASIGSVALLLHISAVMYENGVPYPTIAFALFGLGVFNFGVFEATKQGLALALLCAFAAPLSELVIMNVFGLWHYPHPDAFQQLGRGLPSWVSMCYFFYTPAVGNLARLIWRRI